MKANKPGRDLQLLLLGLAMLVGGLFLLFSSVNVSSLYFSGSTTFFGILGGSGVPTGTIIIPFIIGIVLMIAIPKNIVPKIVTGLGLLIIVLGIISSVRFRIISMNLFNFLMIIILIFGGAALCLRILLSDKYSKKDDKKDFK